MPLTPTETILVVDDDAAIRRYVSTALMNSGYQVLTEPSGKSGFACFLEHADDIDLVVTDIVMPEMSGPEMVRRIQQYRPAVKILFMTGYHPSDVNFPPACGVLRKPFSREAMLSSIQNCLGSDAAPPPAPGP